MYELAIRLIILPNKKDIAVCVADGEIGDKCGDGTGLRVQRYKGNKFR